MKNCMRFAFALGLLCAAMSTASFASSMYVVQGIAGRNYVTPSDPAFPVDVLLNDTVCSVHGLPFGSIQGPLTFEPGTYNVKVSIANTLAPCTNTPLIDRDVTIDARSDVSAVIALNEDGKPSLLIFTNNLSPVAANTDRLLFALAANSAELQIILQNTETNKLFTFAVKPGTLLDANLPAGEYNVEINQGATTLVASTPLRLWEQSVTLLYGLGRSSNDTLVLENRILRDVN